MTFEEGFALVVALAAAIVVWSVLAPLGLIVQLAGALVALVTTARWLA